MLRKGHWTASFAPAYYGGRAMSSQVVGASARITFTGQQVAWVSTVGPTRGQARVYVDGAYVRTLDLRGSSIATRRIVYVQAWTSSETHTLEIRVVGTSGRPRVDVDAFLSTAPVK